MASQLIAGRIKWVPKIDFDRLSKMTFLDMNVKLMTLLLIINYYSFSHKFSLLLSVPRIEIGKDSRRRKNNDGICRRTIRHWNKYKNKHLNTHITHT